MPPGTSRKAKVYGKKAAAKFSATFSASSSPCYPLVPEVQRNPLDDLTRALTNVHLGEKDDSIQRNRSGKGAKDLAATETDPFEDLAAALTKVHLGEPKEQNKDVGTGTKGKKTRQAAGFDLSNIEASLISIPSSSKSKPRSRSKNYPTLRWLKPLTDAYEQNSRQRLTIQKWTDVFDSSWELTKIAESSYAEVYKVSNGGGTSILKIMALKPPKGPGSQRETAVTVENVVSELLIMDMMAEIPGFLEFKEAHIFEGRPPKAVIKAYDEHIIDHESFFPKPASYPKTQLFLALELGDAGTDLEHFIIETAAQIWDIFLGVVLALAQGEAEYNFEHRDLHEGNVCVKQVRPPTTASNRSPPRKSKLGASGLEITLLDYTLSRAENDEEIIYLDLECDPELFASSTILQHQIYRRMRVWTFFRAHGVDHPRFDDSSLEYGSWEDFVPYTNVLWVFYILEYMLRNFRGTQGEVRAFRKETKELRRRLDPDTRLFDGGFESVGEVLGYVLERGWITQEDLDGL